MLTDEFRNMIEREIVGEVHFFEPMSNHSTFKIGGKADVYIVPKDRDNLVKAIKLSKENNVPVTIVGVGSNILIRDAGIDGVVINTSQLKTFTMSDDGDAKILEAEAGVSINDLVNMTTSEGFTGFEFLAGIPGTVGGALHMNAGTHDGSISDTLIDLFVIDKSGRDFTWPKERIEFGYRKAKYPRNCCIISGRFSLERGNAEEILARADELRSLRKERHPLNYPSAGSTFRNPPDAPCAGQLIDEAGLKGVRVGGARISNEHANWIVNEGNATAKDVEVLIHLIKEKVKETAQVSLEPELVIMGRKSE